MANARAQPAGPRDQTTAAPTATLWPRTVLGPPRAPPPQLPDAPTRIATSAPLARSTLAHNTRRLTRRPPF
eukprot:11183080-Lingulodinium_polyedra.AAC.1